MTANGGIFNFWSWREQKDNKNNRAEIDLSPLAGRSVRFILTILATGSATGDRVRWIGPAIVRVEGGTPPTTTPTFTPTVTPTPITGMGTIVPSPSINKLYMMDSSNGWAFGNSYVLRTTDGGGTWYNMSMPNIAGFGGGFFQSSTKAWVLGTSAESGTATLFRTADGGVTWTPYSNVPFTGGSIQFLDDRNGFALAGLPIGMQKHPVSIYQTSDGGATWTLKFAHDPNGPTNGLPLSGYKNGMILQDTSRGWIGGESPVSGSVYIFRTNNGGVTWAQQPMAIPAGYEMGYVVSTTPIFFGANDAILPVWMGSAVGQRDLFLYVTHDGGTTWNRSSAFAQHSFSATFASTQDAFSWD